MCVKRDQPSRTWWLLAILLIGANGLLAQTLADEGSHLGFDAREDYNRGFRAPQDAEQLQAEKTLRQQTKDASVEYSPSGGVARKIRRWTRAFDGAQPGYQPGARARKFIGDYRKVLGLTAQDTAELEVTDKVLSPDNGASHVYLRQRQLGIPVYNGQVQVDIDGEGRLHSITNAGVRRLAGSLATAKPKLPAGDAVIAAAQHLGVMLQNPPSVLDTGTDPQQTTRLSLPELSSEEIVARLMWLPVRDKFTPLVWNFQIHTLDAQHVYDMTVDAASGKVWTRFDWVAEATYSVFPQPLESPDHGSRLTLTNPADPVASPRAWHDTGTTAYTIPRGNNVYAYTDLFAYNYPNGSTVDCGASLTCEFPLDLSLSPANYRQAAVTNLFYWSNLAHDIFYRYGFDEASGNFQVNNFGKGGLGNDYLRAEAQDGGGSCNSNFMTPPDGSPPRMQIYLCNRTLEGIYFSPSHDGDLDSGVIVHEYGHGVSNRLVGGPSNVSCLANKQQMGEGISDYLALVLTAQVGDQSANNRGIGAYLFGQGPNGNGIRPQPYSTDPALNTYTYASINGLSIPHGVGSVWAEVLWRMYWALVDQYGFSPNLANPSDAFGWAGNQRALLYVIDGLKYTSCSPTFVDARDGILASAAAHFGGEDVCTIWDTFANFGLGTDAVSGGANSTTPTNGYAMPESCSAITKYTLTVSKDGTGSGTVTSNTGDINCGSTCSAQIAQNTSVTLTATPSTGSTFAGWSGGGCSGTGTCMVTVTTATTVTATFNTAANPDFAITALSMSTTSPRRNGTFSATVTVNNAGNASGNSGTLRLWTNSTTTTQTCSNSGGTSNKTVGTLAAGQSKTFTFSSLSSGSTTGTKRLLVFVDAACVTTESNESNNQASISYSVR